MFDGLWRPGLGESLTQNAWTDAQLHRKLGSFVGYGCRTRLDAVAGGCSWVHVRALKDDKCVGIAIDPGQHLRQFFVLALELGS